MCNQAGGRLLGDAALVAAKAERANLSLVCSCINLVSKHNCRVSYNLMIFELHLPCLENGSSLAILGLQLDIPDGAGGTLGK